MSLTIKDALTLGGFKKCRLIAGNKGLSNIILHANSMEIPDIEPWLTKGELLITTGYALKNSSLNLIELIKIIYRTKAAGIAIKTRFIGPISSEAITLADELGVPLIEMPDNLPFVEVLNPLIKTIIDEHHARVEFSQTIHNKFIDLELNGGGFESISNVLSTLLKAPHAIVDDSFEIKALNHSNLNLSKELRCFCTSLSKSEINLNFNDKAITFYQCNENNPLYRIRKIKNKNEIYGYLILQDEPTDGNEMADIIIDHAITTIALEFSKQKALTEQMKLISNHFFLDIIAGNIKSEEEARHRAFNLKWPTPPLTLVIFDIDQFDKIIKNKEESYIQNLKEIILNTMKFHLKIITETFTVIPKSDSFTCLIPSSCTVETLITCIKEIQIKLENKLALTFTVGISSLFHSYTSLVDANQEARNAISISRLTKENSTPVFIENKRLEQALLQVCENEYIKNYVHNTVEALNIYDRENNSQLFETLNQLILCMGVKTKAAEKLFLHRNTLMYRIKKIEEITGYNLSTSEDLLSLAMAMKFYPFVKK